MAYEDSLFCDYSLDPSLLVTERARRQAGGRPGDFQGDIHATGAQRCD